MSSGKRPPLIDAIMEITGSHDRKRACAIIELVVRLIGDGLSSENYFKYVEDVAGTLVDPSGTCEEAETLAHELHHYGSAPHSDEVRDILLALLVKLGLAVRFGIRGYTAAQVLAAIGASAGHTFFRATLVLQLRRQELESHQGGGPPGNP